MANQTCSKKPLKPYAPPFYSSRFNHHHASIANRTNKWSVHFPVATGPRNCVVPNRKPKNKPRFNEGAKRLFIKKQHHREIAQVVHARIQGKNSLVKHFEDMRLCRPSKEYLQVWFNPPRDGSMSCLTTKGMRTIGAVCTRRFRESLRRVTDGAEAFLILTLFILCLDKVSTDHAKLVPLGKVCTAKETLEKNTAKGTKRRYISSCATDSLPNELSLLLFQLVGYEGDLTVDEGASSERLSDEQPSPSPAPTCEVPNESLPDSSSAQPSEVPFEQQPDPSPRPSPTPSPTPIVPDSIPEPTGENLGDHSSNDTSLSGNEDDMTLQNVYDLCISLCQQVSDQAKEIKLLKAKITKLKKQAKPVIKHHKAYLKSLSLQQRFPRKSFSKKHRVHKEYVSKQGRKKAKGESSVQRNPLFDVLPEDKIDHMETENAQSEGRTREMVDEDKEFDEDRLSTEDGVSTDKEGVSTDFEKVSTDRPIVSTDGSKVSTDEQVEGTEEIFEGTEEQREGTEDQTKEEITSKASQTSTQTPTSMIFGDDETIATLLLNMSQAKAASKEKEKGVELKDVEEIDRPRPTSTRSLLTLKPLPKIDPKDKGKKKIEEEDESESEDDDIPQAVKKFKQLESDEEMARKIQEEWEAEEERNKIAEEKATNEALIKNFDDIKARIEADRILAEKLQEQEREQFTIEERAKFLHDTIAAQRKFLAQQRSEAIRNRPPTKNQLRNQMMTYLKHVGNFKHSELKSKKFEDIQAMYEKIKRSDEDFIAIGSVEDDRLITKMNKKDSSKGEEIKQESKEELRLCLTIAPDEDKEVDYEILDKKYPIIDWKTENLGTKPQFDESKRSEEINMNVVTRSNGQKRSFSTLIRVLSVFDREDLDAVYKLVMDIYQDKIPEGFDKVLWGDLIVMFNPDEQDEFWNSQHEWKVVSWKLHSSSGVHTLMTDEGLVVHMLIEKKYPLKKEILMQMLKLKLESEEESTMALELIRFIKKSWLVQDQTVLGKDYSNLLIADSLLKTIWFINAPCYDNEALASPNTNDEELSIPEQTATGKGTSNPLMAGCKDPFSLIRTIKRFKLRTSKVRLADNKTLDIVGVGDVVLKTSFSTCWTLKDVSSVTPETWWFGEAEESFLHNVCEDKETVEVEATGVVFGVPERLSQTFRAESIGLRAEASKMLWADSISTTYLIYRIPYVPKGVHIPEEEYTKSSIHLVKNLKACSWAKLVRILISEWSLSLLKILGTKSLAEMFTKLVMKEKLKFCVASTGL
ncbi:hypothetical protein Tco_0491878 [Tanacetum coccineum]